MKYPYEQALKLILIKLTQKTQGRPKQRLQDTLHNDLIITQILPDQNTSVKPTPHPRRTNAEDEEEEEETNIEYHEGKSIDTIIERLD